ncbi:UNVERIFIED_CONTAM: hypothetical protein FKN15_040865 [Acipenser sinensis]
MKKNPDPCNAEAETHMEKQWQGDGTTLSLEEIIIGRCYNYIRVVNPSVGEKNCSQIWEAFRDAFIFKDPCKVLPKDFEPFIRLTVHDVPLNKSLFWENSQLLVGRYADNTKRMMPLDGTLMGWLAQGLAWCGHPGGTGMNYKSCPTTDECEHNPAESFWRIASEAYAKLAAGVIHVMLNGSVSDGAYPVNGPASSPQSTPDIDILPAQTPQPSSDSCDPVPNPSGSTNAISKADIFQILQSLQTTVASLDHHLCSLENHHKSFPQPLHSFESHPVFLSSSAAAIQSSTPAQFPVFSSIPSTSTGALHSFNLLTAACSSEFPIPATPLLHLTLVSSQLHG